MMLSTDDLRGCGEYAAGGAERSLDVTLEVFCKILFENKLLDAVNERITFRSFASPGQPKYF